MTGVYGPHPKDPENLAFSGEVEGLYYRTFLDQAEQTTDPLLAEDLRFGARIATDLREVGASALAVGGYVRDLVLDHEAGRPHDPKDIDIEVRGLELDDLEAFLKVYGPSIPVGASFASIKLINPDSGNILDFSVPRREKSFGPRSRDFEVFPDPSMSIEDASRRRDLTINSMAFDPLTGKLIDHFSGLDDLRAGILRAIDPERFSEDPLRALRVMRLAGQLNFVVDPTTAELCRSLDLKAVAPKRVGDEWIKLLTNSERPSVGMEVGRQLGILDQLHSELAVLDNLEQNPKWHPEGNVWEHTKLAIDAAARVVREEGLTGDDAMVVLFGTLCHDLGKATRVKAENGENAGRITDYGHARAGAQLTRYFLKQLSIKNNVIDLVLPIIREHHFHFGISEPSDKQVRKLAQRLAPANIRLWDLVCRSDANGRGQVYQAITASHAFYKRAIELEVAEKPPASIVQGRHLLELGLKPGQDFQAILRMLYNAQLSGDFDDLEGAQAYYHGHRTEIQAAIEQHREISRRKILDKRHKGSPSIVSPEAPDFEQFGLSPTEVLASTKLREQVQRTIELMCRPEFAERFAATNTKRKTRELETTRNNLRITANQQARATIRGVAAHELGLEVIEAQKLGRDWNDKVREVGRVASDGSGLSLKDYLLNRELALVADSPEYLSQLVTADQALEKALQRANGQLNCLLEDLLARQEDPLFLRAAALWANSADSQDYKAEDGLGYNAGLIHFFEYRATREKQRRFRDLQDPVTVDGFIGFSHRLYQELVKPSQPEVNRRAVMQDSEGNRRFYVLCPNRELIVGFQSPNEALPRMTSMINSVTDAFFDKVLAECLAGGDRGRLNRLGAVVTRLV